VNSPGAIGTNATPGPGFIVIDGPESGKNCDGERPTPSTPRNAPPTDEETAMYRRTQFSTLSALLAAAICSVSAASAAEAGDFPSGTYTDADITIAFDGDGHYRGSQKGAIEVEGTYTVKGDRVQFTDTNGPWACPMQQIGTYDWKVAGQHLTFSKVTDACKERVNGLTPHAWTKQG